MHCSMDGRQRNGGHGSRTGSTGRVGARTWAWLTVVGYETPASVPDIFGQNPNPGVGGFGAGGFGAGGFGSGGFRVAGAGGLANIASILGASGITLRASEDSDEEDDELHIIGDDEGGQGKISAVDDEAKEAYVDDKGIKGDTKPVDVTDKLVSGSLVVV